MRLYFNVMLLLAMWLAIGALPASAEVLKVDFGAFYDGDVRQEVMSGFEGFTKSGESDSRTTVTEWFDFSMSTSTEYIGRVDVTISTDVEKKLGFRNRGDNTADMGDLIEDHVKAGDGDKLYLTLGHLKEGQYTITTYHHENSGTVMCNIDILLDDENGSRRIYENVSQSYGASDATTVQFDFFVGTDPITITFAEIGGYGLQEACLNGFELTPVPEPKAIILLVLGIACLAARGYWRQKRLGS